MRTFPFYGAGQDRHLDPPDEQRGDPDDYGYCDVCKDDDAYVESRVKDCQGICDHCDEEDYVFCDFCGKIINTKEHGQEDGICTQCIEESEDA